LVNKINEIVEFQISQAWELIEAEVLENFHKNFNELDEHLQTKIINNFYNAINNY
jgi:hypothetical protein